MRLTDLSLTVLKLTARPPNLTRYMYDAYTYMYVYIRMCMQVVRLCAKSRESIDSPVSFLALHNQVKAHG